MEGEFFLKESIYEEYSIMNLGKSFFSLLYLLTLEFISRLGRRKCVA